MKPEVDFTFESVRLELYKPVRLANGEPQQISRLVVAPEEQWRELEAWLHEPTEIRLKGGLTPNIRLNVETFFSGDDGPIFTSDGEHLIKTGTGMQHLFETVTQGPIEKCGLSDIRQRLFKATEGTKATLYWWLGESARHIHAYDDGKAYIATLDISAGVNWHIGTAKANESKLESIKHLIGGWWTE